MHCVSSLRGINCFPMRKITLRSVNCWKHKISSLSRVKIKFILGKYKGKNVADMVLISTKMAEFMRDNFPTIKSLVTVLKFMQMVTCTLESFKMVKSMVMDNFFGSIYPVKTQNKMN